MTQRYLHTTVNDEELTVLMGWDKPLGFHFMVIEHDNGDEPIYSNLDDPESESAPLSYFIDKARAFGIDIPESMVARLKADKAQNLGNAQSHFTQDGEEH